MFRVATRLLLVAAFLAAVGGAACSDDDPPPEATAEASGTATVVADPMPQLTANLGDPEAIEEAADGSLVMRWVVDAPSAEDVATGLVERVGNIPGLALTATEVTERGSIIAFEGVRSGHYLVTRSTGQGTPVKLRIDAVSESSAPADGPGDTLPEGFPAVEVPIFPGATILGGGRADLGDGLVRFDVTLESERDAVEVLGYYADLFRAAGWSVSAAPGVVEVHGTGRVTTVWVREISGQPASTTLEVVLRGPEAAP